MFDIAVIDQRYHHYDLRLLRECFEDIAQLCELFDYHLKYGINYYRYCDGYNQEYYPPVSLILLVHRCSP